MGRVRRCQASAVFGQTGAGRCTTAYFGPDEEGQRDSKRGSCFDPRLRGGKLGPAEVGSAFGCPTGGEMGDGEG